MSEIQLGESVTFEDEGKYVHICGREGFGRLGVIEIADRRVVEKLRDELSNWLSLPPKPE